MWKILTDGEKDIQLKLTGKNADSKDFDIVVYENVLYVTADFSSLFGGASGTQSISSISIDLNALAQKSGMDISNVLSEEAKNDSRTLVKETIDIVAKAMPSMFGKDFVINEGNAEQACDEVIAFAKNDLRKVYNLFDEFKQKRFPDANTGSIGANVSNFEESLNKIENSEVTEEDKQKLTDVLKSLDVKITADINGEEGSRVFDFTCNATSEQKDFDGTVSFEGKFEEKDSVDIKSAVPENAMSLDNYLGSMFGATSGMIE